MEKVKTLLTLFSLSNSTFAFECLFTGWPSVLDKSEVCQAPNPIDKTYSLLARKSCAKSMVTCQSAIFGPNKCI